MVIPIEVLSKLPQGKLALVDNRIVAGESTWVAVAPVTVVCTLHPKANKEENREMLRAILEAINVARATALTPKIEQTYIDQ